MSKGELFSRVYLDRGSAAQDSPRFRRRLIAHLESFHVRNEAGSWSSVSAFLAKEGGLDVYGDRAHFERFFEKNPVTDVLDAITLLQRYYVELDSVSYSDFRKRWLAVVAKVLKEEGMGYRVDSAGGIHYFVDEEFERNRVSALRALDATPFKGVRAAFEDAHRFLDPGSLDTKASVRSAFEALEILARLPFPEQKNLNRWVVVNKLKPLALGTAKDDAEIRAVGFTFDGLAEIVDGLHTYRHGQPATEPVEPTLDFAVFTLSVVAASLRWLAALAPESVGARQ